MKKTSLFQELQSRNFVYQGTDLDSIQNILNNNKITFYVGVDPTADSLHIGHLVALMLFKKLQQAGHIGILLFGGATGLIGDPSGKQEMRQLLTDTQVKYNITNLINSAKGFVNPTCNHDNPTIIANNADWFDGTKFIDFMRDIGTHFNVNKMLAADAYANRLNNGGLTFLEMSYMLMQSYDFVQLNKLHNCTLQIGGSDQWGNIVAGTRLYRKLKFGNDEHNDKKDELQNIYGLTCPLLLTKTGKKMGKTEKGTLWLDANKTTPYDFYQYFYNVDDADIETLFNTFTDIPTHTIQDLIQTDIISAKKKMAFEITALVHGKDKAQECVDTAQSLFAGGNADTNAPTIQLQLSQLKDGINIAQLCVLSTQVKSTSQARQLIQSGAIALGQNKIIDITYTVTTKDLTDNHIILKKGKKNYIKVIFK
ncbi:MAG: tyrosine--tRNA ligase [Firmicutes bacterium]|nr:tyrosine--tRNA ligase [Bacillota bacterium]MCL1953125.1 tyrosine--tRNA ligase [Bacillota bacterium]